MREYRASVTVSASHMLRHSSLTLACRVTYFNNPNLSGLALGKAFEVSCLPANSGSPTCPGRKTLSPVKAAGMLLARWSISTLSGETNHRESNFVSDYEPRRAGSLKMMAAGSSGSSGEPVIRVRMS